MQDKKVRYSTLIYSVRKALGISIAEYLFLDMIAHLSRRRWCNKSLQNIADDMGTTKVGVMKLRDRMIARGYLEKNHLGNLRTTDTYEEIAYTDDSVNSVNASVNKVNADGKLSLPKNNIKNNIKNNKYNVDLLKQMATIHSLACELFRKNPNRYKLSDHRKGKLAKRIKELGVKEVQNSLRALASSPFHNGENDRGWAADPYWVIETYERCEKFASAYEEEGQGKTMDIKDFQKKLAEA